MNSIFIYVQTLWNGYPLDSIYLLSLISLLFAISVITTKNPVLSVLCLIGLFFTISVYLMLIGLYFLGISYLLVYVGAVSILFLFILMLINVRVSELHTEGRNSVALAVIAVILFSNLVQAALPHSAYLSNLVLEVKPIIETINSSISKLLNYFTTDSAVSNLSNLVYEKHVYSTAMNLVAFVMDNTWDSILIEVNHISSIGNMLYSNMFILLIITSFILLLAMVGCIVITLKHKK